MQKIATKTMRLAYLNSLILLQRERGMIIKQPIDIVIMYQREVFCIVAGSTLNTVTARFLIIVMIIIWYDIADPKKFATMNTTGKPPHFSPNIFLVRSVQDLASQCAVEMLRSMRLPQHVRAPIIISIEPSSHPLSLKT